ncbi:MAG: SLC13 family permease [Pseudomonadota bacterium]
MEELSAIADWRMWAVFAGVAVAIFFFCWEKYAIELVSAVIVATALVFFHLFGDAAGPGAGDLLAGFANPALVTILALLIVGQGIFQTGALEGPTRSLLGWFDIRPKLTIFALFLFAFAVSAFLNNTPVVVMFIPILGAIAARMQASPSKLMMPLSFVCVLAGMTTLIGSSTNLLVADVLQQYGQTLGFFEPTYPGLILAGAGLLYIVFIMPHLLPDKAGMESEVTGGGKQYIAQIEVSRGHPLIGQTPVAGMFPDLPDVTVRMIQRGESAFLPPFDSVALQSGDIIIVAATRKALTSLLSSRADFMKGVLRAAGPGETPSPGERLAVTEAVVSPGSRLVGRSIKQIGFRHAVGALVLGVQRRSRMLRARMSEIRLEAGDVLLLFGSAEAMRQLRADRDLLLMEWATSDVPDPRRANMARLIFAGVIAAAATGFAPIVVASVAGAAAMVAAGCLNVRQAARAFDQRLYLLIGAAFALGVSLQSTGGADVLAFSVVALFQPFGQVALLSAIFLLVMALTNVLSNNATAILFTPIAVGAAVQMNGDPVLYALTVLFAANTCFATPIGYQTNLLVMGPGKYAFMDYFRAGAPLSMLIWLVFTAYLFVSFSFG